MKKILLISLILANHYAFTLSTYDLPLGQYNCNEGKIVTVSKDVNNITSIQHDYSSKRRGDFPCVTNDQYKISYHLFLNETGPIEAEAQVFNSDNELKKTVRTTKNIQITSFNPLSFSHMKAFVTLFPVGDEHCSPSYNSLSWEKWFPVEIKNCKLEKE